MTADSSWYGGAALNVRQQIICDCSAVGENLGARGAHLTGTTTETPQSGAGWLQLQLSCLARRIVGAAELLTVVSGFLPLYYF